MKHNSNGNVLVGNTYDTNDGGLVVVLKYEGSSKVTVRTQHSEVKLVQSASLRRGRIGTNGMIAGEHSTKLASTWIEKVNNLTLLR